MTPILQLKFPKATLKIFSTGSITVTAPSVANVQAAVEHIYPKVGAGQLGQDYLAYIHKKDLTFAFLNLPGTQKPGWNRFPKSS